MKRRRRARRKRHFRPKPRHEEPGYFYAIYPSTGAVVFVDIKNDEQHLAYLEAHSLIPEGLEDWSDRQVLDLVATDPSSPEDWMRVAVLLGHQRSQMASDLLRDLCERVPPELETPVELAYVESLAWRGYSVVREPGRPMMLVASGTPDAASEMRERARGVA